VSGFALADRQGKRTGLDVDTCRAVAAAMFGDADKIKYVPTTAQQRFTALQSGEVDVLARTTTWTLPATPRWASISPASITTTARASW
jgi:general L-amino acid transport system substrate-binding protein